MFKKTYQNFQLHFLQLFATQVLFPLLNIKLLLFWKQNIETYINYTKNFEVYRSRRQNTYKSVSTLILHDSFQINYKFN